MRMLPFITNWPACCKNGTYNFPESHVRGAVERLCARRASPPRSQDCLWP